jgi:hypothetical protein
LNRHTGSLAPEWSLLLWMSQVKMSRHMLVDMTVLQLITPLISLMFLYVVTATLLSQQCQLKANWQHKSKKGLLIWTHSLALLLMMLYIHAPFFCIKYGLI